MEKYQNVAYCMMQIVDSSPEGVLSHLKVLVPLLLRQLGELHQTGIVPLDFISHLFNKSQYFFFFSASWTSQVVKNSMLLFFYILCDKVISFMQCNLIIVVVSLFLQVHVSIQDQSCPLPRVHEYSQPFFLEYPQVVGAIPPMRVI